MNKTVAAISLIFWLIAVGLYLTAMLTNFWVAGNPRKNYGLFYFCKFDNCEFVDWDPRQLPYITIPRIIMLGGAGFIAIGLIFGIFGLIFKISQFIATEGALDIIGGLVVLSACAAFTAMNYNQSGIIEELSAAVIGAELFHYSFYFGWISGLLFVIAGVCGVIAGISKY